MAGRNKIVLKKTAVRITSASLALAFLLIGAFALTGCAGSVPEDRVRQDVTASGIVADGLLHSQFVEDTPYELAEFKIDEQKDEPIVAGASEKARTVAYSGTIRNESIETRFTGIVYYRKQGDEWVTFNGPANTPATSIPLKGVDSLSTSGSMGENESIESFEATLDESNGSFTSTAKQISTIDEWFATDAITTEQGFTFTSENGWKQTGDPKVTATKTDYKLAGKKFSCTTVPGIYDNEGKVTYFLTFTDVAEDGTVTADYIIDYDPLTDIGFLNYAFGSIHEKGTLTGKMDRQAGLSSFSVELNDPSKGVTLECASTSSTMSAGTGTVNAASVKAHTSFAYKTSPEGRPVELSTSSNFTEVLG